jgi:hypothetical protein
MALSHTRSLVVDVAAARRKADSTVTKSAGLALHTTEPVAVIEDKVVPSVLAEGYGDREACIA